MIDLLRCAFFCTHHGKHKTSEISERDFAFGWAEDKFSIGLDLTPDAKMPAGMEDYRQPQPGGTCGLLALDPQLVCDSWVTGIADVAQVVFVRKRLVEIQYFRTTISDEQREEFGHLVQDSMRRIEAAEFLLHSGIRFSQNPCTSCPYI